MNWTVLIVLALLVGVVLSDSVGRKLHEGFAAAPRSDIGLARDGWAESSDYERDLRYSEAFVDIQGLGVAADFCRAVRQKGDPDSLHMACALGNRDGMNTMEYRSRSKREGFRFSRDDYWRANKARGGRMDYCRIVKDELTGHHYATCAIAGADGFKPQEERDTEPPQRIQELLRAYQGILTWFRWRDDREDYAESAALVVHGRPEFPAILNPTVTRGLQLNRWSAAAQAAGETPRPLHDFLRWGEQGTLHLDQTIQPRQIRAISFWIWWDTMTADARVLECSAPAPGQPKRDLMWLGIEGGGPDLPPAAVVSPAREAAPSAALAIGQLTEPAAPAKPTLTHHARHHVANTATYVFEIWDTEQRIMRLESPQAVARVGEWQHVVVTTTRADEWWPTWHMYVNGSLVATRTDGRLSPALFLTDNFIGKNVRGCLQDFRVYRDPMSTEKIAETIAWGKPKLHPQP